MRVDAKRVYGIQRIRAQLQSITCRRSLDSLSYFFARCAADQAESDNPWSALEEVDCSSNTIHTMDGALTLFPVVKTLDLSDNSIEELSDGLRKMHNLAQLNLGYNQISSLKALSHPESQSLHRLSILVLCNNRIGSLHGVECLTGLTKLDLSSNEIVTFDEFRRIRHLEKLRQLWIGGNPVAYEKHWRARVLALVDDWQTFLLDGIVSPTIEEQLLVEHYIILGGIAPPKTEVTNYNVPDQSFAEPPEWEEEDRCHVCSVKFTWRYGDYPRHHCRSCGRSTCHQHSSKERVLAHFGHHYEGAQRTCDPCFSKLQGTTVSVNPHDGDVSSSGGEEVFVARTVPSRERRRRPKAVDIADFGEEPKAAFKEPRARDSDTPSSTPSSRASTPKSTRKNHPPNSPLVARRDANSPKRSHKKKKKKSRSRKPSDLLAEQESLRAQVDQIFEAGGNNALAIYQAWVDQNAENIVSDGDPNSAAAAEAADPDAADVELTATPPAAAAAALGDAGPIDLNSTGPLASSTPEVTRKQLPEAAGKAGPAAAAGGQTADPVVGGAGGVKQDLDKTVEGDDGEPAETPVPDDSMFQMPDAAAAESTAEFLVDLFDRTNQTCSRIIQIQGSSCVMVIDFITGKTVDMVDLTCLMTIENALYEDTGRPTIKLTFVYGHRDRRAIEFVMESTGESDQLIQLLQPVADANKASKLNESVTARFKCLKCDHVFTYEEQRFHQAESASCPSCRSSQVVEFFFNAADTSSILDGAADWADINSAPFSPTSPDPFASSAASSLRQGEGDSDADVPTCPAEESPYAAIKPEPMVDIRAVDHNRKLLLDLEYFDEEVMERCLGGLACYVWVPQVGGLTGFVVCSTKAFYAFRVIADETLSLVAKYDYQSINHLDVSLASQRIRIVVDGSFLDIFPGESVLAWEFVTLLADNPVLSSKYLYVDSALSRAVAIAAPDVMVQLQAEAQVSLGCMQDMISVMDARVQMREKVEPLPTMDLSFAMAVKVEGHTSHCLLLVCVGNLYLLRFQHDVKKAAKGHKKTKSRSTMTDILQGPALKYPYEDVLEGVTCQDLTDIQSLRYSPSRPHEIAIEYWNEGGKSAKPEDSR